MQGQTRQVFNFDVNIIIMMLGRATPTADERTVSGIWAREQGVCYPTPVERFGGGADASARPADG
jgi:hypothetical protein